MLKINVDFSEVEQLSKRYTNAVKDNSDVVKKVRDKTFNDVRKYVPRDTGRLMDSAKRVGSDSIEWDTSYAKYVHEGKTASGRNMVYKKTNTHAGPKWNERYANDSTNELSSYAARLIDKMK